MTREDKVKALEAVKEGVPARFALEPDKYKCLFGNLKTQAAGYYVTRDMERISIEQQLKYFPDSFIFQNVSLQYPDYLPIASDMR